MASGERREGPARPLHAARLSGPLDDSPGFYHPGWSNLGNGVLLTAAATAGFDCLLTVDRSIQFQQNRSRLPLAVVVLVAPNNQVPTLSRFIPHIQLLLAKPLDAAIYVISADGSVSKAI